MNAKLLRAVLTRIEEFRPSGEIAADIAGRALLESKWTLTAANTFRSPDGKREVSACYEIEDEAQALLDVTDDDLWAGGDFECLFTVAGRDEAVRRLRELTETAEEAIANA